MKTNRMHKKSWITSLIGIGCLTLGIGVIYLFSSKDPSDSDMPQEQTETMSEWGAEETPKEEKVAREGINPFTQTTVFEHITASSASESALLEIKIADNGDYQIKECITGEICSKGVWQYDMNTHKIILTHVGDYPMQNVFAVEEHPNTDTSEDDPSLNSIKTEQLWQIVFIAEESTNLRYDLLEDGDIFVQKSIRNANQMQLHNIPENEKGVI